MRFFPSRSLTLCLALSGFLALAGHTTPAGARTPLNEDARYRSAFAALDRGEDEQAYALATNGSQSALNAVLMGELMAQSGNAYNFEEVAEFLERHPEWPGRADIQTNAEQRIPADASPTAVIGWFEHNPPVSDLGFERFMNALEAAGHSESMAKRVRARWIARDFTSPSAAKLFVSRYAAFLTRAHHRQRLDRLVWEGKTAAARDLYPLVSPEDRALAEARLVLADPTRARSVAVAPTATKKKGKNTAKTTVTTPESLVANVPKALRNNEGLLWARAHYARVNNLDDTAQKRLAAEPQNPIKPELWWKERAIMARRAMEQRNWAKAYTLARGHHLTAGAELAEAEFLAGWLALRRLNKPQNALGHFERLAAKGQMPITRARAAYWRGRALAALGRTAEAQNAYAQAATLDLTWYGQLARASREESPVLSVQAEAPTAEPNAARKDDALRSPLIEAVRGLLRLDETDRAGAFFKVARTQARQRSEFRTLTELAYDAGRPDWAVEAAKGAAQHGIILRAEAFPILVDLDVPTPPEEALTHAVIRQESLFRPDATSPAGAQGLMQLMPGTARDVARQLDIPLQDRTDPAFNLKLGTTYLSDQIERFEGSYIMALAAYNAGPGRISRWIETFGDPRQARLTNGSADPLAWIDWIELIPVSETRNYVQRIMENLQAYRARLNGGSAPLRVLEDVVR